MRTFRTITDVTRGEVSPRLWGRTDSEIYRRAAKTMKNMLARPQGMFERRPGFRLHRKSLTSFYSGKQVRIRTFQATDTDSYAIEFSGSEIEIHKIGDSTYGHKVFIPSQNFTYGYGGWNATATATEGVPNVLNGAVYLGPATSGYRQISTKINVTPGATYTFNVGGSGGSLLNKWVGTVEAGADIHASTGFGSFTFTVPSNVYEAWLTFNVSNTSTTVLVDYVSDNTAQKPRVVRKLVCNPESVDVVQSVDVMYVVSNKLGSLPRGNVPQKIKRNTDEDWSTEPLVLKNGPFGPYNINKNKTLRATSFPSWSSGEEGVLVIGGWDDDSELPFAQTDVDMQGVFWLEDPNDPANYCRLQVKAGQTLSGNTSIAVIALDNIPASLQNVNTWVWRAPAFGSYNGFPRTVFLYQDRLVFGGTDKQPDTLFFSATSDYEDFDETKTTADAAFQVTLNSREFNGIQWIDGGEDLVVGTQGEEWFLRGSNGVISNATTIARTHSSRGSERIAPVKVGQYLLFVQAGGRRIREFIYDYDTQSYKTPDVTIIADHLMQGDPVVDIALQREPDPIIWCVTQSGKLVGLTYDRDNDVFAWHQHDTPSGNFLSVTVVRRNNRDVLVALVDRGVLENGRLHIEWMDTEDWKFASTKDARKAVYFDMAVMSVADDESCQFNGNTSWGGSTEFKDIANLTINGLIDATEEKNLTVASDGTVNTKTAGCVFVGGLEYQSMFEALPVALGQPDLVQGRKKGLGELSIQFIDSLGAKVNDTILEWEKTGDKWGLETFGTEITPVTERKIIHVVGWSFDAPIKIESVSGLPLGVAHVAAVMEVSSI